MHTEFSEELVGIPISTRTMEETITTLAGWIDGVKPRQVATANLDFLRLARQDVALLRCLQDADMVTADGAPLLWLSQLNQGKIQQRVAGSDMMTPLFAIGAKRGWRVYFLGGSGESAQAAAERASRDYPGLVIAGAESPRVDLADVDSLQAIAQRIQSTKCDLLLVGLGCPKQEFFLRDYLKDTGARVGIGVGGSFDFLAGTKNRAPRVFRHFGLEWLYRWSLEPRRLTPRYARNIAQLPGLTLSSIRDRLQFQRDASN